MKNVSIHLMLLFIETHLKDAEDSSSFQYISCYSLSLDRVRPLSDGWWFQYISCYSLSPIETDEDDIDTCFNTSHVTLYQKIKQIQKRIKLVSIHLMLLFIGKKCQDELFSERFNTSHVTLYPSFYRLFFF